MQVHGHSETSLTTYLLEFQTPLTGSWRVSMQIATVFVLHDEVSPASARKSLELSLNPELAEAESI